LVPQAVSVVVCTQEPVESQQPAAQLSAVHLSVQVPLAHVCAPEHAAHETPPVPQAVEVSSVLHLPSAVQQPLAQVDGPQTPGVVASALPPSLIVMPWASSPALCASSPVIT